MTEERRAYSVQPSSWPMLWLGARKLLQAHAEQFRIGDLEKYIGRQQDILDAEAAGQIVISVAMTEILIFGYIIWAIAPHPGLGERAARMGPWFVEPEWRASGAGTALFEHSLQQLRSRGCRFALPTLPARRSQRIKSPLRGAKPFEVTYMIELS